jgi:hypothetical protein
MIEDCPYAHRLVSGFAVFVAGASGALQGALEGGAR